MSYNIIAGGGVAGLGASVTLDSFARGSSSMNKINTDILIGITKANGGTIVQVKTDVGYDSGSQKQELYIIPDDAEDFDKELGKIISLNLLKKE